MEEIYLKRSDPDNFSADFSDEDSSQSIYYSNFDQIVSVYPTNLEENKRHFAAIREEKLIDDLRNEFLAYQFGFSSSEDLKIAMCNRSLRKLHVLKFFPTIELLWKTFSRSELFNGVQSS